MKMFWERWSPYWHICTTVLLVIGYGIVWVGKVSAYDERIAAVEMKAQSIPVIEQKVDDMSHDVHEIRDYLMGRK